MKRLYILVLLIFCSNLVAMKQAPKVNNKDYAKECQITLEITDVQQRTVHMKKPVFLLAPHGLRKAVAVRYLEKKSETMYKEASKLVTACTEKAQECLLKKTDQGQSIQPTLGDLLFDPKSIFEYRAEQKGILLRRDIGGNKQSFWFTELFKIESDEGLCSELMIGCHNDAVGLHDTFPLTQIEKCYEAFSGQKKDLSELCKDPASYEPLRRAYIVQMATFVLMSQKKYKPLFIKK